MVSERALPLYLPHHSTLCTEFRQLLEPVLTLSAQMGAKGDRTFNLIATERSLLSCAEWAGGKWDRYSRPVDFVAPVYCSRLGFLLNVQR